MPVLQKDARLASRSAANSHPPVKHGCCLGMLQRLTEEIRCNDAHPSVHFELRRRLLPHRRARLVF
jgi:hypothetical protein